MPPGSQAKSWEHKEVVPTPKKPQARQEGADNEQITTQQAPRAGKTHRRGTNASYQVREGCLEEGGLEGQVRVACGTADATAPRHEKLAHLGNMAGGERHGFSSGLSSGLKFGWCELGHCVREGRVLARTHGPWGHPKIPKGIRGQGTNPVPLPLSPGT